MDCDPLRAFDGALATGLSLEGLLYGLSDEHGLAITLFVPFAFIGSVLARVWLPETLGQRLRDFAIQDRVWQFLPSQAQTGFSSQFAQHSNSSFRSVGHWANPYLPGSVRSIG